jgi:hypothetical protein
VKQLDQRVKVVRKNRHGRPLGIYYQARCPTCNERLSDFDFSPEESVQIATASPHRCWANPREAQAR